MGGGRVLDGLRIKLGSLRLGSTTTIIFRQEQRHGWGARQITIGVASTHRCLQMTLSGGSSVQGLLAEKRDAGGVLCVKDGHERTNPDFAMYDMAIPEKPHRDTEGHKMLNDFWIGTPGVH